MLGVLQKAALMAGGVGRPRFISFAVSTTSGTGISLSIPAPSGIQAGDLLVSILGTGGATVTWTDPSGWTEIANINGFTGLRILTKVATGSEPGSYTFTSSNTRAMAGHILALRNAQIDVVGSFFGASGNVVMPSVTAAGGILIGAASSINSGQTYSTPAGMTATATKNNGNGSTTAFYEEIGGGSTGSRTSTVSVGGGVNSGLLIGVKRK